MIAPKIFNIGGPAADLMSAASIKLFQQPGCQLLHLNDGGRGTHLGLLNTDIGELTVFDGPAVVRALAEARDKARR